MNYKNTYEHERYGDIVTYSVTGSAPVVKLGVCIDKYDATSFRDGVANVADTVFSALVEGLGDAVRAGLEADTIVDQFVCGLDYTRVSTEPTS